MIEEFQTRCEVFVAGQNYCLQQLLNVWVCVGGWVGGLVYS